MGTTFGGIGRKIGGGSSSSFRVETRRQRMAREKNWNAKNARDESMRIAKHSAEMKRIKYASQAQKRAARGVSSGGGYRPGSKGGGNQGAFANDSAAMLEKFAANFDTFGSENRKPFQEQLLNLFSGKTGIEQSPGFSGIQGVMDQASERAMRKLSSTGNLYGGDAATTLGSVNHDVLSKHYSDYVNQLMQASGASFQPNQGAGLDSLMSSLSAASGGQAANAAGGADMFSLLSQSFL